MRTDRVCGLQINTTIAKEFTGRRKTVAIYHNACLEHNVPESHLEKPDRLRAAISAINELQTLHPTLLDISTNPAEGILFI